MDTVLVDVGTGYYVEKSTADAQVFYKNKVDSIQQNITDLEKIITQKSQNVRIVEECMSSSLVPLPAIILTAMRSLPPKDVEFCS